MSRPAREGGYEPMDSVPPDVKWRKLRAFLTTEAGGGKTAALHLLREMRGKPGAVES